MRISKVECVLAIHVVTLAAVELSGSPRDHHRDARVAFQTLPRSPDILQFQAMDLEQVDYCSNVAGGNKMGIGCF